MTTKVRPHTYSDPYRTGRCLTCNRPAFKNVYKDGAWVKVSNASKVCK